MSSKINTSSIFAKNPKIANIQKSMLKMKGELTIEKIKATSTVSDEYSDSLAFKELRANLKSQLYDVLKIQGFSTAKIDSIYNNIK